MPTPVGAPSEEELGNATYRGIYGAPVTLEAGEWAGEPFVPGGASRPRVVLAGGLRLTGDLDGDGMEEAVVVLAEGSGGSGTNEYLAVVARRGPDVVNLATALVGDRVQIRSGRIASRRIELEVVRAGPEDAACCPGEKARITWALGEAGLEEVQSESGGRLSLLDLEGVDWVLTQLDRNEPAPARPEVTLRIEAGQASGSSGCNRYFANLEAGEPPGSVAFGAIGSTRMACPEATMELERRYLETLQRVGSFGFVTGRLFLSAAIDGATRTLLFAPITE